MPELGEFMFTKNYFSQKQKRLKATAGSSRFPTLKFCISFSSGSLYCVRNTNFTCKLTKSKHKNNLGNALNGNTDESCCKINCVRCLTAAVECVKPKSYEECFNAEHICKPCKNNSERSYIVLIKKHTVDKTCNKAVDCKAGEICACRGNDK